MQAKAEDGALRFQMRIREVLRKYDIALPLAVEEMLAVAMCRMSLNGENGGETDLDKWAAATAQMIVTGLLREEGWELPGEGDEEITTKRLTRNLKEKVHGLLRLSDR